MKKCIIYLLSIMAILLLTSCISFDEDSSHDFTIVNYSNDTVSVVITGDSIDTVIDTLSPKNIDFRNASVSFYNKMYYDQITAQYDQNRFENMIDSFSFKIKVNDDWEIIDIPGIMSLDNWKIYISSDDFILGHNYFFHITDSLLNQ